MNIKVNIEFRLVNIGRPFRYVLARIHLGLIISRISERVRASDVTRPIGCNSLSSAWGCMSASLTDAEWEPCRKKTGIAMIIS